VIAAGLYLGRAAIDANPQQFAGYKPTDWWWLYDPSQRGEISSASSTWWDYARDRELLVKEDVDSLKRCSISRVGPVDLGE
jgi:hypothetical protein